jgi:hypothetical protein
LHNVHRYNERKDAQICDNKAANLEKEKRDM